MFIFTGFEHPGGSPGEAEGGTGGAGEGSCSRQEDPRGSGEESGCLEER